MRLQVGKGWNPRTCFRRSSTTMRAALPPVSFLPDDMGSLTRDVVTLSKRDRTPIGAFCIRNVMRRFQSGG